MGLVMLSNEELEFSQQERMIYSEALSFLDFFHKLEIFTLLICYICRYKCFHVYCCCFGRVVSSSWFGHFSAQHYQEGKKVNTATNKNIDSIQNFC